MTNPRLEQTPQQYLRDAETRFQAYSDAIPARTEAALNQIDQQTKDRLKDKSWGIVKKVGAPVVAAAALVGGMAANEVSAGNQDAPTPKESVAERVDSDTITKRVVVNGREATITIDKQDATPAELLAQYQQENGQPVENYPNLNNK